MARPKKTKAIFVASTGQNVGKTTLSLGLFQALKNLYPHVGYLKAVGQQTCEVEGGLLIDKDVELFRQTFALQEDPQTMSPVVIPPGTTRDFLDGKKRLHLWKKAIKQSFEELSHHCDFVLCEGTGHVGVGSILGLDNAVVAKLLNLPTFLIAKGGLGSAIDKLHLNASVLRAQGCDVPGILLNRVLEEKSAMLSHYVPLALKKSSSLSSSKLLGMIPYKKDLSAPSLKSLLQLLQGSYHGKERGLYWHVERVKQLSKDLVSHEPSVRGAKRARDEKGQQSSKGTLYLCPSHREDLLCAIQASPQKTLKGGAMVLCGHKPPSEKSLKICIERELPLLICKEEAYKVIEKLHHFVAKLRADDAQAVQKAISHVVAHLDLDALWKAL